MIRDIELWERFNRGYIKSRKLTYRNSAGIFRALWMEARHLGVIPTAEPLKDIEAELRIAAALNYRK